MSVAIWCEFIVGKKGLPSVYSGLFMVQVQRLLNNDIITKAQWISSVWNAQDRIRTKAGLEVWEQNTMTANFIQSHKKERIYARMNNILY